LKRIGATSCANVTGARCALTLHAEAHIAAAASQRLVLSRAGANPRHGIGAGPIRGPSGAVVKESLRQLIRPNLAVLAVVSGLLSP